MKKLLLSLIGFPVLLMGQGQVRIPGPGGASLSAGAVPVLVNHNSRSNTGTNAVGTKADNTCATDAYCTSLSDPSLAGNAILVAVTYANSVANVPTVTDDKANTYTHCASEANDTTNTRFADVFYVLNATTGTLKVTVTFSAAVTHVSAIISQWANINAFDGCAASQSTSAVGTFSSGSITSTVSGDLFYEYACATNAFQNTGIFTAGTGQSNITWRLQSADRRDGCAAQSGVQSASGALNPQMTIGTNAAYVAVGIAFKAASQGTAPSGFYIAHMQAQSMAPTSVGPGPFNYQFPSQGNLLIVASSCSALDVTAISDGTNTWRAASPIVGTSSNGNPSGATWYAENATGSGTLALAITLTSTSGDCSFWDYDVVGADPKPFLSHMDISNGFQNAAATFNALAYAVGSGGSVTGVSQFFPGSATAGASLSILETGLAFNTAINCSAPTGAVFDSTTVGAENISGPYPVDENNTSCHQLNSDDSGQTWTINVTRSSLAVANSATTIDSFLANGAAKKPTWVDGNVCTASSGTSHTCSYTPHYTGNPIALAMTTTNGAGNYTVTDSAGNTIVRDTGTDACTVITSFGCMKVWYITSVNTTSSDTFTFVTPTVTQFDAWIVEMTGVSAFDAYTINTETISAGTVTSAAVATAVNNEILLGICFAHGTASNGTNFQFGRGDSFGNAATFRILTASGSFSAVCKDSSSGTAGIAGIAFK